MATYTITPRDYQYLQAMLTHEAQNTLQNDLNRGNLNSAYGQMTGLVETWLNRAMAKGTDLPSQMLARNQLSYFSADKVPTEAAQLDPRITQMLNTYLHSRNAGDPGILGSVNQYLNRDVTDALYSQKYRDWYDKSQLLGAFGDKRSGGRSSLEQEFLNNPEWQVPQYDVRVSPQIQLSPSEGDVNALSDFRNSYLMPTPLPPGRPDNGLAGIAPRGPGEGNYEPGILDQFSDGITRGLETVGRGASDLFNGLFGGAAPPNPAPGDYDFATGLNVGGNPSLGLFGSGVSPNAPTDYSFAGGFNPSQGVSPGVAGQLPAGFDPAAYLRANTDVAAAGIDPAQHYLNFGRQEGRALGPPGLTQTAGAPSLSPTFGSGTTAPTYGPDGSVSVTSQGLVPTGTMGAPGPTGTIGAPQAVNGLPPDFDARSYLAINPDVAASGIDPGTHYRLFGAQEGRAYGAPGLTGTQGSPDLTGTYGPPAASPTLLPDGGISVMSPGLVPTQGAPSLTPTMGPGPTITARPGSFNGAEYLKANGDVAASGQDPLQHFLNYGAREGRAIDTLGNHFNGDAYLAQNRDVAMAGMNPLEHFLRYGAQEARTLAPTDWASPLTAFTNAGTYGAPAATQAIGAPSLTPTQAPPDLSPTIGPPALTGTYGPPATTPTLNPTMTTPSWSPFGGAGVGSPFGFSGSNVGGGLGAGPQTFGSYYPVGSGGTDTAPASSGPDMSNPFGFTNMDVSGFDANAYGGGGGGGAGSEVDLNFGSGFDEAGAMRNVLAQQAEALRLKDLAVKTPMHTDPNAFNAVLANGGNAVGFGTPLQNPGAVQAPVVPNLTVTNAAMGAPGAMFSMFAPWR